MEIKITPKVCEPGDAGEAAYEGFVRMRVPNWDERQDLKNEFALSCFESGDIEDTDAAKRRRTMKLKRYAAKRAPAFVLEVRIVRKEDGHVFDSLDAMTYDTDMDSVIAEVVDRVIGRHQVGKTSTPS